ncbi:MAG: HD domain-containing protein [Thermodesulfobacteriota bacterium]|nr:HD domain-containing protein [Thermodesulfobacteriota bacterium]
MKTFKHYVVTYFEQVLVLVVLVAILFAHYFVFQKMAFLNFYYLPVLLAGFFLGRKTAVLFSVFCILLVSIFCIIVPEFFRRLVDDFNILMSLTMWGSFLILTSYIVGTLFENNKERIKDLKKAYMGVLEILSKYLESSDRYTKGHSIRVSNLATEIAIAMERPRNEVENIKAAALLHDIGKVEVSMELIQKAASLSNEEKKEVDTHSEKGAQILLSVGDVLKEAVPIVLAHHKSYGDLYGDKDPSLKKDAKMGACIVSVADTYDAITSDRPYRAGKTPRKAIEEIEEGAGKQFHPQVVEAFQRVLALRVDDLEKNVVSMA